MNALEIKNLTKSFGGFKLDNLNLTLPTGCIMGLIGENGAGKTTTIKLILDMIHKDGGTVTILGRNNTDNIKVVKEDIGVVTDEMGIPECLTANQVGNIMKYTFKNWKSEQYINLLNKFSLPTDKPFKDFSKGMKMKLGIAVALSHGSKLLLFDEATGGLDPVARDDVIQLIRDFVCDGEHSVLFSSHIVSDLEKICDYIAFLHKGNLLICEEKDRLLADYGIIHCACEQLNSIDPSAIVHKRVTSYGAEAVVRRNTVPNGINISPISIEELFVCMVKEED